jgi:hypothetical protein
MALLTEREKSIIVTNANSMVIKVFDKQEVGNKAIHTSQFWASFPVPLGKREVVFRAKHKCGSEITRLYSFHWHELGQRLYIKYKDSYLMK